MEISYVDLFFFIGIPNPKLILLSSSCVLLICKGVVFKANQLYNDIFCKIDLTEDISGVYCKPPEIL